jgi:hypothetical protein
MRRMISRTTSTAPSPTYMRLEGLLPIPAGVGRLLVDLLGDKGVPGHFDPKRVLRHDCTVPSRDRADEGAVARASPLTF